jgi:hypothetical protein
MNYLLLANVTAEEMVWDAAVVRAKPSVVPLL